MLLSSKMAAEMLGFSQSHIRRLVRDGIIKAEILGNSYLIKESAIKNVKRRRSLSTETNEGVKSNGIKRSNRVSKRKADRS